MKQKILLVLFTICLVTSTILAFVPTEKICNNETSGCSIVQSSNYEKILGINNSYFGIIAFTLLILLILSNIKNPKPNKKMAIKTILTIASIIAIYFIYLQLFVIKAICPYCMTIDILTSIAFLISVTIKDK